MTAPIIVGLLLGSLDVCVVDDDADDDVDDVGDNGNAVDGVGKGTKLTVHIYSLLLLISSNRISLSID
jgi:hypothetical protein